MKTTTQTQEIDKKITLFTPVRIDDLFIGIEKDESSGFTCYYITVSPNTNGSSTGTVKSAGSAIESDDAAIAFLEKLHEIQLVLNLPKF